MVQIKNNTFQTIDTSDSYATYSTLQTGRQQTNELLGTHLSARDPEGYGHDPEPFF